MAWVVNLIDESSVPQDLFFLLPTSLTGARSVLSTVAAATITVSALVFSITAVSVQLASQYSPRVLQEFLRDRFQKNVVGFVSATFTFSLLSLATLGSRAGDGDLENVASWSVTTSTVLGVGTVLAIVAFIDRTTRRVRVEHIIRRITTSTSEAMRKVFSDPRSDIADSSWDLVPATESTAIRATRSGWVRDINPRTLLAGLPPGTVARVDIRVGDYVTVDDRLVTLWSEEGTEVDVSPLEGDAVDAIAIGESRSTANDPAFGLRQLLDIALRALSPGINDPGTATVVVYHLVEPLRIALTGQPRSRFFHEGDRHVAIPLAPDREDFVSDTLAELRQAMQGQVLVATALVDAIGSLKEQLRDSALDARGRVLDRELRLLLEEIETWERSEADLEPVRRTLTRKRLQTEEAGKSKKPEESETEESPGESGLDESDPRLEPPAAG